MILRSRARYTEADMRHAIRPALKRLHGFGVETATMPGVPDLNHVHGWVELKVIKVFEPVVEFYCPWTPQQRAWALERQAKGGRVQLLSRTDERDRGEWFLHDARVLAREWAQGCPESIFREHAARCWNGVPDQNELVEFFRGSDDVQGLRSSADVR